MTKPALIILCSLCLMSCKVTRTPNISYSILVHPTKTDSTADYQACSYNYEYMLTSEDFTLTQDEEKMAKEIIEVKPDWQDKFVSNTENRKAYKKKVDLCLKEHGWKRVEASKGEGNPTKTEFIPECLESSKVGDKISHELMNQCLDSK